jgi:hypothetical protein
MRLLMLPVLLPWWLLLGLSWPLRVLLRHPLRWLWTHASWHGVYLLVLLATVFTVNVAGQRGAQLTHGADYSLLPPLPEIGDELLASRAEDYTDTGEYYRQVKPVMDEYCSSCHGAGKQKGNLRVDERESLLARRNELPAVHPGNAMGSDMVRRMLLARDHEQSMPPSGEPQPPAQAIFTVAHWIDRGALFGDPAPANEAQPEVALGQGLSPPDPALIQALRERGLKVQLLAENSPLLLLDFSALAAERFAALWQDVLPLSDRVAWVNLSGQAIPTELMFKLGAMQRLTRLDLQGATVGEGDLLALSGLSNLRWLNLRGTGLRRADVSGFDLPALEALYVSAELP